MPSGRARRRFQALTGGTPAIQPLRWARTPTGRRRDARTRLSSIPRLQTHAGRASFLPDELVDGPAHAVDLAGRRLSVGVERGVSGGDVWVFDHASGVLDHLLACAASERTVAECSTGWVADLGPLLPAAAQRSIAAMLGHYVQERLRTPAEQARRYCRP